MALPLWIPADRRVRRNRSPWWPTPQRSAVLVQSWSTAPRLLPSLDTARERCRAGACFVSSGLLKMISAVGATIPPRHAGPGGDRHAPMRREAAADRYALHAPRVLQLDQQLVRIEAPSVENRSHVVVVDDKEIADRPERPAQPGVGAHRFAIGVVLDVARHGEIGRDIDAQPCADHRLREGTSGEPA